jgi:arylformamidase
MEIRTTILGQAYYAKLNEARDISIPLDFAGENPNCFYAPLPTVSPVIAGDFIGDTSQGGLVNFKTIQLNPHGNGTHTECVGHIAQTPYFLPDSLQNYHFTARLITIYPQRQANGDRVIERQQLATFLRPGETEAVVIRTMPNDPGKRTRQYSGTNPPYLAEAAAQLLCDYGVEHLLLDLPSVDREDDDGVLAAHRTFWQYPYDTRKNATITELCYLPAHLMDGLYLLNLQITSILLDASPSKPVLYPLYPLV